MITAAKLIGPDGIAFDKIQTRKSSPSPNPKSPPSSPTGTRKPFLSPNPKLKLKSKSPSSSPTETREPSFDPTLVPSAPISSGLAQAEAETRKLSTDLKFMPKCDQKSKACAKEVFEIEVDEILVSPATLRRL